MTVVKKLKLLFHSVITKIKFYINIILIKRIKINNFKKITVLGRGESLNVFKHYNENIKCQNILLTNFEKNDIIKSNLKKILIKKNIILLSNIIETTPSILSTAGLSIDSVYVARFNNLSKYKFLNEKRINYRLDSLIGKTNYLPDSIQKFLIKKGNFNLNTGILGVLLATSFSPKEIYIFGLDFYESEYFAGNLLEEITSKHKKELLSMKESFKKIFNIIIKNNKKINFTVFTKAKLKIKSKNIKIIKV
jgi:hypothetical protein